MARLIRAVDLMKRTDRYAPYISDTVRKELRYVPTVDAVEVVRCKDCQYYHIYRESDGHTEKGYGACDWINDNSVRKDHFCSWGERREDDNH